MFTSQLFSSGEWEQVESWSPLIMSGTNKKNSRADGLEDYVYTSFNTLESLCGVYIFKTGLKW